MTTLHITNGDVTVQIMQQAGIQGEILPWRDVLHEGPVPMGMTLSELSAIRARYIADQGWSDAQEVSNWFQYRDSLLENFKQYDALILWFEHDLYDQLQLIQILAWLATQDLKDCNIQLICVDNYLGMLTPPEMAALQSKALPIKYEQIIIATTAWQTFTASDPLEWQNLLQQDTECLPFLEGAVLRLLQEYPDLKTGLTLTQKQALQIISEKSQPPGKVFAAYQQSEERRFMGDSSFWGYLAQMLDSDPPLMLLPEGKQLTLPTSPDQVLSITEDGRKVLSGEKRWSGIKDMDRWIGGVHLKPDNLWFWDEEQQTIENLA